MTDIPEDIMNTAWNACGEGAKRDATVALAIALALLAERERQGAKPIETAPKDGTKILVYGEWAGEIHGRVGDHGWFVAEWSERTDFPGFDWVIDGTDYAAAWCSATHWAPLPSVTPSSASSSSPALHVEQEREGR